MSRTTRAGIVCLSLIAAITLAASAIAPHDPGRQFADLSYAPPMRPHSSTRTGTGTGPFVYPLAARRSARAPIRRRSRPSPVPLEWFSPGTLVTTDESRGPWLLLGGGCARPRHLRASRCLAPGCRLASRRLPRSGRRPSGRDSSGRSPASGAARSTTCLMRVADFVLVLPGHLRRDRSSRRDAARPRAPGLSSGRWPASWAWRAGPIAARGVRAVVAAERSKEYAEAARALGAGPLRILLRHLLPAATGLPGGPGHAACCRPSSWPKPRCRSWGSDSRNLLQAGELCSMKQVRPGPFPRPPGCSRRRERSSLQFCLSNWSRRLLLMCRSNAV